jgi:hypothetical protein
MLYRMMRIHEGGPHWPYNEVVVAADGIVVEAVYGSSAQAARMHRMLLSHLGVGSEQLPLLNFRPRRRDPFELRL